MALRDEGVCLIVPCDSSILSLPCLRKLAVKLSGTQSNSAVDQTAKYSSKFGEVCRVQVYTVTPATLHHCAQQDTGAHSDCHYVSHFDSALKIPSPVVQTMQCNKTSWKWETNRHQKLVSVTLAVWKLNDNTPHTDAEIHN